jgi:hypothetical protein
MASPTYAGNKPIGRGVQKNDDRSPLGKLRCLAPVTAATIFADQSMIALCALFVDGSLSDDAHKLRGQRITGKIPLDEFIAPDAPSKA